MSDPIQRLSTALEGRYRIERTLGEGGMAIVYLAADLKHGHKVTPKVLAPELGAVVGADRFLAEIKTTADGQHPHTLPLFESGVANGLLRVLRESVPEGVDTLRAPWPGHTLTDNRAGRNRAGSVTALVAEEVV